METDRRTRIADAIIETLARAGSRGLTHRAVDQAAGLPQGSTSYYLRTRDSLMDAAVARLAEADSAALRPAAGESLAGTLARVLEDLLRTDRDRTLARYELCLEAVRRPELRETLDVGTDQVRQVIADQLARDDKPDPDALAGDIMALFDGLLFRELTAPPEHRSDRSDIQRAIDRVI